MQRIVITISEIYLDRLTIVAEMLHKDGLSIIQVYEFGVIVGEVHEEMIPSIRKHKEVVSLIVEKQVGIPPPDSQVQ